MVGGAALSGRSVVCRHLFWRDDFYDFRRRFPFVDADIKFRTSASSRPHAGGSAVDIGQPRDNGETGALTFDLRPHGAFEKFKKMLF